MFTTSGHQGDVLAEGLTDDTNERATVQHLQKKLPVNTSATGSGNSPIPHPLHYEAGREAARAVPELQGAAGVGHGGLSLQLSLTVLHECP